MSRQWWVVVLCVAACSGAGKVGGAGGGTSGSGGGSGGAGGGTVSTGPMTVVGRVVNSWGAPAANIAVVVIGGATTTSDVQGNFMLANVSAPYDIAVVGSETSRTSVTVFKGLTRSDPTLTAGVGAEGLSGQVTGQLTGSATLPTQASSVTRMAFVSPETSADSSPAANPYELDLNWVGPTTTTGTVHAVQFVLDSDNLPASYKGYGALPNIAVTNLGQVSMKDVVTSPVSNATLTGSVSVPTGLSLQSIDLSLQLGPGAMYLASDVHPSLTFAFQTPVIPDAKMSLSVQASSVTPRATSTYVKNAVDVDATGLQIPLSTVPFQALPAGNATGLDLGTQSFSWASTQPAGIYVVDFNTGDGTRELLCITAEPECTLPPTDQLGLGSTPSNVAMTWQVTAYGGGPTTTDALTGMTGSWFQSLQPATADYWFAGTDVRDFTTR